MERTGAWWCSWPTVAAVATVVAVLPAGPWPAAVEVVVFLLGASAVVDGLRRHAPVTAVPWRALATALVAFAASSAAETLALAGAAPATTGALEIWLNVLGYGVLTLAGAATLAGQRARHTLEAWVDVATLVLAGGLTMAVWSEAPGGPNGGPGVGLPLVTAVVLVTGVRIALPGSGRSVAGIALFGAGVVTLVGYAGSLSQGGPGGGDSVAPAGDPARLFGSLPLLAVALVSLAAQHPSMGHLGETRAGDQTVSLSRFVGLGAALLVSPALVLLWAVRNGNGYLLGPGIAVLTALSLWRIGRLVADRDEDRAARALSEARLRALLQHTADVIAVVGSTGRLDYVSPAVTGLLARTPQACLGRPALALVVRQDRHHLQSRLDAGTTTADPDTLAADVRLRCADGSTRWVEIKAADRSVEPAVQGWVVNVREITERKRVETALHLQATTDPLTHLVNRSVFSERLAAAMAMPMATPMSTAGPTGSAAVLLVDLDDFKPVNDRLGHAAGDALLVAVAGRLRRCVRDTDTVARIGGDEFAVLLPAAGTARVHQVAHRIGEELRHPFGVRGMTVTVSGTVGAALAAPTETPDEVVHRADTAMYAAKRAGKDRHVLADVPTSVPAGLV